MSVNSERDGVNINLNDGLENTIEATTSAGTLRHFAKLISLSCVQYFTTCITPFFVI
jgi:hypothetical protein